MNNKKSEKANLESRRPRLFVLGFIGAAAITLSAFEWQIFEEKEGFGSDELRVSVLEEEIIQEYQIPKVAKPQPPTKKIDFSMVPKITPDDEPDPVDLEKEKEVDQTTPEVAGDPSSDAMNFDDEVVTDEPAFFTIVEDMPHWKTKKNYDKEKMKTFTEGKIFAFITDNIKYPQICKDAGIEGKAFITFEINEQGDVTVIDAQSREHKAFAKEGARVIGKLPQFEPGMQRKRPVKVRMTVPINFKLN